MNIESIFECRDPRVASTHANDLLQCCHKPMDDDCLEEMHEVVIRNQETLMNACGCKAYVEAYRSLGQQMIQRHNAENIMAADVMWTLTGVLKCIRRNCGKRSECLSMDLAGELCKECAQHGLEDMPVTHFLEDALPRIGRQSFSKWNGDPILKQMLDSAKEILNWS